MTLAVQMWPRTLFWDLLEALLCCDQISPLPPAHSGNLTQDIAEGALLAEAAQPIQDTLHVLSHGAGVQEGPAGREKQQPTSVSIPGSPTPAPG